MPGRVPVPFLGEGQGNFRRDAHRRPKAQLAREGRRSKSRQRGREGCGQRVEIYFTNLMCPRLMTSVSSSLLEISKALDISSME